MLEQVEIHGTGKSQDVTNQTVKISAFKKGMPELERLYMEQQAAAEDYAASVKAIAETSGLNPVVIRKAVKAKVHDKINEAKHEAEQMSLALEEVGG